MARLIKTEKEVEGRYTETWVVVEEDALDPWPAGPREVVGRPAAKVDGSERARGEARYTADVACPGCCDAAYLRSPHARAQLTRIDPRGRWLRRASARVLVAGDVDSALPTRSGTTGARRGLAADTTHRPVPRVELIEVEWDVLDPLVDPEEAVRRGSLIGEPRRYERGDFERGLAEADVVVEAEYRTQTSRCTTRMEPHDAVCGWRGRHARRLHLDAVHLGRPRRGRRDVRSARRQGARRLRVHGRRLRLEERRRASTRTSQQSSRAGRAARCTAATDRREENMDAGNRNAHDPAPRRGRARRRHAHGARRRVRQRASAGRLARRRTAGPMQMLYACPNVRTVEYGAKLNLAAERPRSARPGSSRERSASSACSTSSPAKLDIDPLELRRMEPRRRRPRGRAAVLRRRT